VEHLAALCFQVETIEKFEGKLIGQTSEEKIAEICDSTRDAIGRLFYGSSGEGNPKRVHVNDFLRSLEKLIPDIRPVYDYLCDFVHPNYGSNLLVSTGTLGRGHLDPPTETHIEHLVRACAYALKL
jgi:hypothetical protein